MIRIGRRIFQNVLIHTMQVLPDNQLLLLNAGLYFMLVSFFFLFWKVDCNRDSLLAAFSTGLGKEEKYKNYLSFCCYLWYLSNVYKL